MPDILIWSAALAVSLAVLLKGADVFVEQASTLARSLGVSDLLIGVSVVALGTSLPELAASLASVFSGAGEFVAGTVVGSNVANILFILGVAALAFRGMEVSRVIARLDLPAMVFSALVLTLLLWDGRVSRPEGLVLVALYVLYLMQTYGRCVNGETPREGRFRPLVLLWLALSGAAVYLGAEFTVRSTVEITSALGLADTSLLAITVVAVGSSLPELVVTLTGASKRYYELSLGNVVGSNICNSFLVMGAPAVIRPVPGSPLINEVGLPYMMVATLALFAFGLSGRLGRTTGLMFLLLFGLYLGTVLGMV